MSAQPTPDADRLAAALRELLESLTQARTMVDVAIAAGIALNEPDGVEEAE